MTLIREIEKFLRFLASLSASEKRDRSVEISEFAQAAADQLEDELDQQDE